MDYKATLNLPKTTFAMKADLPTREPERLAAWRAMDLYGEIRRARDGAERFILHDGPPYANGDIHIGHALNKILKDIIVRYKTMRGLDAPYVPGWDCHGMPIEHQLFKELKLTKQGISQADFRAKARAYAERYVDIQREQFKRLGVLGDWDRPYLTMAPDYERTILRVFRELVRAGDIYRGKKPVYWCATCETALAEAEVEYEDRRDASIYVAFPFDPGQWSSNVGGQGAAWPFLSEQDQTKVHALIWTTTPWTIPANVALLIHPHLKYAFVRYKPSGRIFILLEGRVDAVLRDAFGWELKDYEIIQVLPGNKGIHGHGFLHPFLDRQVRFIIGQEVSAEEGTGIVHIAPGHGEIDYILGTRQKPQLSVLSPVDAQGRFTKDVGDSALEGLRVLHEGNQRVITLLEQHGRLLGQQSVAHSYPHCWRCQQPVIFRATPQWFLKVDEVLRAQLLQAVRAVTWIPSAGLSRISGMLESRPDWCLSRQRYWGTPIPVLHCERCDQPILDATSLEAIERVLAKRGTDVWFTATPGELLPGGCPTCHGRALRKETDILDVWFDSGVSHEAVLKTRPDLRWPADLYLEGSDQHRGWFQVSLIPAVALRGKPPYTRALTHGFVMDGEGRKMSKSLGNVIAPQDVMQRYGADILRLWVASSDYREDVRISEEILAQVAESYRKIRNTFRYLLANLHDFDPARDARPRSDFQELDRWALHSAQELLDTVTSAYEGFQFHEMARAVYHFCVLDLSAFYLDALKDRLYTELRSGVKRRCAQSVLYAILERLVKIVAPVLVVTADEVWQVMREAGWVREPSVHLALWPQRGETPPDAASRRRWETLFLIRDAVMRALEEQRSRGVIGSPLEARVTLRVNDRALQELCESHRETLAEAFVVSGVEVQWDGAGPAATPGAIPGLTGVTVERAPGKKCARCWKLLAAVGSDAAHPELCERCVPVVTQLTREMYYKTHM